MPRFDEYLKTLRTFEQKRRKRQILKAIPLVILASGMIWFAITQGRKPQSKVSLAEILPDSPRSLVKADNAEWLDIDKELGTVYSEALADSVEPGEPAGPIWFTVDISGRRQANESLVYRIENYQTDYTYTIDFGNGVIRPVQESTVYRYPLPGHFVMKLIAKSPAGDKIEYVKKYEIVPGPSGASPTSQDQTRP